MKTSRSLVLFAAALAAIGFTGCMSPESRIEKNPQLFASYSPAQQDLIKQGKVAIGFDMDAVRLALGAPDRVRTRVTNDGNSENWVYVTYETTDGQPLYRGWYHRYYMRGDPIYPWYETFPTRREREHFHVVFDHAGKVTAIEQDTR